jgi:hypothetical protein
MSVIHLTQIKDQLKKLFEGKIDLSDVVGPNTQADQKENFFLTRSLAAYALYYLAGATEIEAANAITDGGDDNGIDAIYYDERERRLYLVQSKWIHSGSGEPENGDIKKLVAGIRDLFNLLFDRFNEKINAKREIVLRALTDTGTRYEVVVVYTGVNKLAEPSSRDLADLVNEMNDATEVLSSTTLNQTDLYNSLTVGISGEPINLEIGLKSWGRVETPQAAYYGQVDGGQISAWWAKYRSRLFTKNLRGVLGDTDVNDEIRITIDKMPELFWYFNNGVTLICKKVAKTMVGGADTTYGTFVGSDVSVVNGAQTVATIGKFGSSSADKVERILVPVRLISLENAHEQFGGSVTKTNNRQNRIENRDFVSLDPEQTRIRTELALGSVEYHLMRSEGVTRGANSFDLVESTTALADASGDIGLVVQLKREIGKLWENVDRAPYKQLFNPHVNGIYIWRCVQVQREIDSSIEMLVSSAEGRVGKKYGMAVHGNRVIAALVFSSLMPKQFSNPAFAFEDFCRKSDIPKLVENARNNLTKQVETHYFNAMIPTLFKNLSKCKRLYDLCR